MRRSLAVLAAAIVAPACSLLVGTSGLDGARPPPADEGGIDATADAASPGPGPTPTSGASTAGDGAPPEADGSSSPCAKAHLFCADFDEGAVTDAWNYQDGPAAAVQGPGLTVSPPNALTIQCGNPDGACGVFKLLAGATHHHIELDVAATADQPTADGNVIAFSTAGGNNSVNVERVGNALQTQVCDTNGCDVTSPVLTSLTATVFRHVAIDVQWVAPSPKLDIAIDGVSAFSTPIPAQTTDALRLILGCDAGCLDPFGFRVDNVVVDAASR